MFLSQCNHSFQSTSVAVILNLSLISPDALEKNHKIEFERSKQQFLVLKVWHEHFRSVKSSFEELMIHVIHACTIDQDSRIELGPWEVQASWREEWCNRVVDLIRIMCICTHARSASRRVNKSCSRRTRGPVLVPSRRTSAHSLDWNIFGS